MRTIQWVPAAVIVCLTSIMAHGEDEAVVADGAELKKLADGFKFTEGPASDAIGNVYFTDQPNDRILMWSVAGELTTFLEPAGRSNGLYFDADGWLWACADGKNELWRIDPKSREHSVVVAGYGEKLFNGPNDVWVRSDGGVFFTDPYYQRPYWERGPMEQDEQAVYFIRQDQDKPTRVGSGFEKPNGLIGTPDGARLYVADIGASKTYVYDAQADGSLTNRKLFCEQGSDGMTIDERGNIYLTGRGVSVFNPEGEKIAQIDVPERWTANVCFGGPNHKTLFITASTGLYAIEMAVVGAGPVRDDLSNE